MRASVNSGPDVARGVTTNYVNSMVDMAPTIFQMLGVTPQSSYGFDGSVIPYTSAALEGTTYNELVQVEGWTGNGNPGVLFSYMEQGLLHVRSQIAQADSK